MKRARRLARTHGAWVVGSFHRRARCLSLTSGVSFGGGQKKPGNLCNTRFVRRLIRRLLRNPSIRRIAGFQSSGLALYAPKLYRYCCKILRALFEHHPVWYCTLRGFPIILLLGINTLTYFVLFDSFFTFYHYVQYFSQYILFEVAALR
ncbi:hypothetical protein B0H14DRAFT_2780733 [Mycena olivaceomarginata]|nr:hypothetical protein B0H14DRAFT_2780733 [Mycena olivaceomarginata]